MPRGTGVSLGDSPGRGFVEDLSYYISVNTENGIDDLVLGEIEAFGCRGQGGVLCVKV
jgi:hypothetical protein